MALDLDAVQPARPKGLFEFVFAGETYQIDGDRVDVEVWEYLQAGAMQQALLSLLGEAQYDRLKAADAAFTSDHMVAMVDGLCEHLGIDRGKSRGRSTRSQRTLLR